MKEIKIIKLVSFLLFVIPISALLFILSATNHLVSYGPIKFPNGIQKEQKFKCNESNDFCNNIRKSLKKIKLTECSLKKYKFSNLGNNLYKKNIFEYLMHWLLISSVRIILRSYRSFPISFTELGN